MKKNINVVCYGEILWDNMPDQRRVGGAPLNVCYHLIKGGLKSQIVSQVGDDADGRELLDAMGLMGVERSYTHITKSYPTSRVEVTILPDGSADYEIVEQVAWDYIDVDETVLAQIQEADAFVFGSLVTRSPRSRKTLFTYLASARCAVFDVNLRAPFYSKDGILKLVRQCHILKVNSEELDLLAEWIGTNKSSEAGKLWHVLEAFPNISEILLTKGARGARYYSRELDFAVPAPKISIVDTVGSGDSFLAMFLARKFQGAKIEEAMEMAVALSAYVSTQHGACPAYNDEVLVEFKKLIHFEVENDKNNELK